MTRSTHPALAYMRALYAKEDPVLAQMRSALEARDTTWQIGAEEGKILQLLVKLSGVKKVVELGTLCGYSTLWLARALPEDGQILTIEKEAIHAGMAKDFLLKSEISHRIHLFEGDAHDILEVLGEKGPYDMLFIDADKIHYNNYLDWAESHIRKGGLVVGDNTLLFGTAYHSSPPEGVAPRTWNEMRRFNERLADESRWMTAMLPTDQGMTVAIKLF